MSYGFVLVRARARVRVQVRGASAAAERRERCRHGTHGIWRAAFTLCHRKRTKLSERGNNVRGGGSSKSLHHERARRDHGCDVQEPHDTRLCSRGKRSPLQVEARERQRPAEKRRPQSDFGSGFVVSFVKIARRHQNRDAKQRR